MRLRITILRYFFLALAVVCLGLYSYSYLERVLYQSYESREFERTMPYPAAAAPTASKFPPPNALIGRLSVPRLHLSAMVREGIDRTTLELAVGHIPATAFPGQGGNVGVAGHRDTFFRGLEDVKRKDEILFSTLNGDFRYEVESLTVVGPDDVGVLASSFGSVLTLVTCFPFSYLGAAPKRFIVRARQVSPQTAPASLME